MLSLLNLKPYGSELKLEGERGIFWCEGTENEEREPRNEIKQFNTRCTNDTSVKGTAWPFLQTFGCSWYYPKPQGKLL